MNLIARLAAAASVAAVFFAACDLAVRAPWYYPAAAASAAVILAGVSAWIRRTTNPNTDDKDTP